MKKHGKKIMIFCILIICIFVILFKSNKTIDLIEIRDLSMLERLQNEYVYFGRNTCNQCKKFENNIEKYTEMLPNKLYYINTDYWREKNEEELKHICNKYMVTTVPKIVLIKEGKYMGEINVEKMINEISN